VGLQKKDVKKAPSGAVVDYTANRRKKGAAVRGTFWMPFSRSGPAAGVYPLPPGVCKI